MIKRFKSFIKEELKVSQLDESTLEVLKRNLKDKLMEYKMSILSNIKIDNDNVKYIGFEFDRIDKRTMVRELENEFTKDLVNDFKVKELLDNIEDNMSKRPINIKPIIRELFKKYFKKLENIKK
jgi:hypothetical protein